MDETFETEWHILDYYLPGVREFDADIEYVPNIKEKHLDNAIKHIAFEQISFDDVFAIIDTTMFRSFKSGIVIGRNSFFVKNIGDKYEFKYSEIIGIIGDNQKEELLVYLSSRKAPVSVKFILTKYDQFAEMVQQLIKFLTGREIFISNNESPNDITTAPNQSGKTISESNINSTVQNEEVKTDANLHTSVTNTIKNESDNSNLKNTTTDSDSSGYPDDYVIVDKTNLFKNRLYAVLLPIGVIAFNIFLALGIWLRIATILGLIVFEPYIVLILIPKEKYGYRINSHENAIKYKINFAVKSIPLDQVQTCEMYCKIDHKESLGKFFSPLRYVVVFSGRFGTHRRVFHSEFPQQQLYAALHEFCNMY